MKPKERIAWIKEQVAQLGFPHAPVPRSAKDPLYKELRVVTTEFLMADEWKWWINRLFDEQTVKLWENRPEAGAFVEEILDFKPRYPDESLWLSGTVSLLTTRRFQPLPSPLTSRIWDTYAARLTNAGRAWPLSRNDWDDIRPEFHQGCLMIWQKALTEELEKDQGQLDPGVLKELECLAGAKPLDAFKNTGKIPQAVRESLQAFAAEILVRYHDKLSLRRYRFISDALEHWHANGLSGAETEFKRFGSSELATSFAWAMDLIVQHNRFTENQRRVISRSIETHPFDHDSRIGLITPMLHDPSGPREHAQNEQDLRNHAERLEVVRELIAQRCRQIVKVFNGLFDREIDPDAVLNGQVTGEYASIQSMPASMGIRMAQRMTLAMSQHQILEGRTWLEIEEGDDEQEMRDAFESANLLVWHELCHLVRPSAVDDMLKAVPLPADSTEADKAQARELVLDALAMRLGQIAYAHPPLGEDFPRTEEQRLQLMRCSLSAMARRVVRHLGQTDFQPGQHEFILRLAAELQVHAADGSARAKDALEAMQETFAPLLEQGYELQEKYAALYGYVLAMAHVTSLPFRGSLDEDEQDGCSFGCAAPTIH